MGVKNELFPLKCKEMDDFDGIIREFCSHFVSTVLYIILKCMKRGSYWCCQQRTKTANFGENNIYLKCSVAVLTGYFEAKCQYRNRCLTLVYFTWFDFNNIYKSMMDVQSEYFQCNLKGLWYR
jgi:hypothetical protein